MSISCWLLDWMQRVGVGHNFPAHEKLCQSIEGRPQHSVHWTCWPVILPPSGWRRSASAIHLCHHCFRVHVAQPQDKPDHQAHKGDKWQLDFWRVGAICWCSWNGYRCWRLCCPVIQRQPLLHDDTCTCWGWAISLTLTLCGFSFTKLSILCLEGRSSVSPTKKYSTGIQSPFTKRAPSTGIKTVLSCSDNSEFFFFLHSELSL